MTHCREERGTAHYLLERTREDLMNEPWILMICRESHVPFQQWNWWKRACMRVPGQVLLFEVVTSWRTALGEKCLTLTCPPYSFHSEGSARLHKESFVLQHVQWIYSCTRATADDWMMTERKSSSWEGLQKPLDPREKKYIFWEHS